MPDKGRLARILSQLGSGRAYASYGFWGAVEYLAYPLLMFAATPFFLRLLGASQYGQWMLLITFTTVGGLTGLGMGAAALREVSTSIGQGDTPGAVSATRTALTITMASSAAFAGLAVAAGLIFGPAAFTKIGRPEEISQLVVIAALLLVLEQVDTVFAGVIRGMHRFALAAKIEVLYRLGLTTATLAAAFASRDLGLVLAATTACAVLRLLVKGFVAQKLIGQALYPHWNAADARRVFAFGKWAWMQNLGALLFATIDRMLVGSLLGAEALARYSVCMQLAQQVQAVPSAAAGFVFPLVARRQAEAKDTRGIAWMSAIIVTLIGLALAGPLVLFGGTILRLWAGAEMAQASGVLTVLTVAYAILAAAVAPHHVLMGANRARRIALSNLFAGLASVAAAATLIPAVGLMGAAVARVVFAVLLLPNYHAMHRAVARPSAAAPAA